MLLKEAKRILNRNGYILVENEQKITVENTQELQQCSEKYFKAPDYLQWFINTNGIELDNDAYYHEAFYVTSFADDDMRLTKDKREEIIKDLISCAQHEGYNIDEDAIRTNAAEIFAVMNDVCMAQIDSNEF